MRRQGRAKRMPRQGGLRVGVGGRCKQVVPRNPPNTPAAQTPAAARARRAKPGANAPARQSKANAAPGRITGGGGRAVQASRTTQPTQHPRPPNTRGSASPKGEARREAPARQSEANAAPGRITGGGGRAVQASRTTQPTQHPRRPNTRGSASPKGEARREAPARQSEANAAPGRITGGGGRAV